MIATSPRIAESAPKSKSAAQPLPAPLLAANPQETPPAHLSLRGCAVEMIGIPAPDRKSKS